MDYGVKANCDLHPSWCGSARAAKQAARARMDCEDTQGNEIRYVDFDIPGGSTRRYYREGDKIVLSDSNPGNLR